MTLKKVLYINGRSEDIGGGEKILLLTAGHIDKSRFCPVVVLPQEGPLKDALERMGVDVYIRPLSICHWFSEEARYRLLSTFRQRVAALSEIIEREKIALVHTNSFFVPDGAFAAARCGIGHITHAQITFTEDKPIFKCFDFHKNVCTLSDRIIVVSKAVKNDLLKYAPPNKIELVYYGIDLEEFKSTSSGSRASIRKELGIDPATILVCAIGRIDIFKRFDRYIKAAAEVLAGGEDVKFLLVGPACDKKHADSLKELALTLKLQDRFIFTGPRYDIPDILSGIDIFVLSSDREGMPITSLEAMAASRPVIATRCGGPEEAVVDNETGLVVEPEDHRQLSGAIAALVRDPGMRKMMGEKGRNRVERLFGLPGYIKKIEDLYENVLSAGSDKGLFLAEEMLRSIDETSRSSLRLLNDNKNSLTSIIRNNRVMRLLKKLRLIFK